jgi:hypothetical protein
MGKERLRVRLSMVRGTMAKIKIGIYSERKAPDSNRKAGTGETLGGLMRVGPARESLVLRLSA